MRDESSQYAGPIHANCHRTSSISLVQRQRRCDGRTYQAETVEQQVDGGWRNEDAVVQQLERPVYIAQTGNPVPGRVCRTKKVVGNLSSTIACVTMCFARPHFVDFVD